MASTVGRIKDPFSRVYSGFWGGKLVIGELSTLFVFYLNY